MWGASKLLVSLNRAGCVSRERPSDGRCIIGLLGILNQMLDRKLLLGTTVIAGFVAALAVATPTVSFAQTTPPATTADDEDDTEVEALVVTGSRIKRSEFTSSAPIQVITVPQNAP